MGHKGDANQRHNEGLCIDWDSGNENVRQLEGQRLATVWETGDSPPAACTCEYHVPRGVLLLRWSSQERGQHVSTQEHVLSSRSPKSQKEEGSQVSMTHNKQNVVRALSAMYGKI